MSNEEYGKENCMRCKQCEKKVLVLVLKDLDKNAGEDQVRECLMDLVIKPNPDLKAGQLVTFEEDVHNVYNDGLMSPIKVTVEVPPEVIQRCKPKSGGAFNCFGSKKGPKDISILQDIDLNVRFVIDDGKGGDKITCTKCKSPCKATCRAECKRRTNT